VTKLECSQCALEAAPQPDGIFEPDDPLTSPPMDPVPVYASGQKVWLWMILEGSPQGYWTQATIISVNDSTSGSARFRTYNVSYYDRYNRKSSTTVGPHMLRARRGLLPSEDGL